ncbi:MAG: hypothetical protein IJX69_05805 [Oscillospiraceae bacterium]|nr:hypothetical protein [Oscillospiraceae bacterium]
MGRKPDIQYIHQFYVPGSEAQKVEIAPKREPEKAPLPLFEPAAMPRPARKIRIHVDFMSLCGIVVAVTMLALMLVGIRQYEQAHHQHVLMQEQVYDLRNKNVELNHTYQSRMNLEEIAIQAAAMGMIPAEQAQTATFVDVVPQPEPEPTAWENFQQFIAELFGKV